MATYHLRAKVISRGKGQSAVAAAAYRSGERLIDAATGAVKHYQQRADRVLFAGIFAPAGASAWAHRRNDLWNQVEQIERRCDATLAREIELSLPCELTDRQRLWLVQDFVRERFQRRGFVVDAAIHRSDRGGDARNFHAHLLIVERHLGPGGFAAVKDRSLQSKATLRGWRSDWAKLVNRYLERHGHAARIDHRSLKAQGIDRRPTKPLGWVATQKQRRVVQARNAVRGVAKEIGRRTLPMQPGQVHIRSHKSAVERTGFRPAASWGTTPPSSSRAVSCGTATATDRLTPASMREGPDRSANFTPDRIAMQGAFRALALLAAAARLAVTPCETTAAVASVSSRPMRPETYTAAPLADAGDGAPDELGGLLEAIAAEVNARAGVVCDGIEGDFANRIRQARRLPQHLAAAEIAALRQAKKAAVMFVRESAAMEISGRQKQARVMFRRQQIRIANQQSLNR